MKNLTEEAPMRLLILCGKGGVGKSTLAAALGLHAGGRGHRTLVLSVDPAHSLDGVFERPVGAVPVQVAERVWACELSPAAEIEAYGAELHRYASELAAGQGLGIPEAGEIAALPGVAELAALVKLQAFIDGGQFDWIVLDAPPTGSALKLLAVPAIAVAYVHQAQALVERLGPQLAMGLAMLGVSAPMPPATALAELKRAADGLKTLPERLTDPARTTARLVLTPDTLALDEAKEAYRTLSIYGLTLDGAYLNRALPEALAATPFFAPAAEAERAVRAALAGEFPRLPLTAVPLESAPPRGVPALTALAARLAGEAPDAALQPDDVEPALTVEHGDGTGLVGIHLPLVNPKDVDLGQAPGALILTVSGHRRVIRLPAALADAKVTKAKFSEGRLLVTLARP